MRGTPRRPPDGEWEGTWLGEGVGMDHGKGAGTTEPASVGPAGDAGPMRPGGTKTRVRPYCKLLSGPGGPEPALGRLSMNTTTGF